MSPHAREPRVRRDAHRHADGGGPGRGPSAGAGGRRARLPHEAVFAARAHGPGSLARPGCQAMAGSVALSQALSYAHDLKSAYEALRTRERELAEANDRLLQGYQQSLQ